MINCSFCGRDGSQYKRLISSHDCAICNECVAIAVKIMLDTDTSDELITGTRYYGASADSEGQGGEA